MNDREPPGRIERVGFIGLGIMGRPMATNLRRAARSLGLRLTFVEEAERLYGAAADAGLGERDFAAVMEVASGAKVENP